MVNIGQVQRGVARYLDEEFTSKLSGWQKWVFGAGSAMAIEKMGNVISQYQNNSIVKAMDLISSNGEIDLDTMYNYLKAEADKCPVSFSVPVLGTVSLTSSDVDKLYNLIQGS